MILKSLTIIGTGRVGTTFGYLFARNKIFKLLGIYNRKLSSSKKIITLLGKNYPPIKRYKSFNEIQKSDFFLITTSDGSLQEICKLIAKNHHAFKNSTLIYCSGSYSRKFFAPLLKFRIEIICLHPLKSFNSITYCIKDTKHYYVCYDGPIKFFRFFKTIFKNINSTIISAKITNKALYHIASVFCSNYALVMLHESANLLRKSGINNKDTSKIILSLMVNTLEQFKIDKEKTQLTGPIARGDIETLKMHLKVLQSSDKNKNLTNLYKDFAHLALNYAQIEKKSKTNLKLLL